MEQKNIRREEFWSNSGTVNEELDVYHKMVQNDADSFLTMGDALFSLICC